MRCARSREELHPVCLLLTLNAENVDTIARVGCIQTARQENWVSLKWLLCPRGSIQPPHALASLLRGGGCQPTAARWEVGCWHCQLHAPALQKIQSHPSTPPFLVTLGLGKESQLRQLLQSPCLRASPPLSVIPTQHFFHILHCHILPTTLSQLSSLSPTLPLS